MNGTATTYCYDHADRLTTSSDAKLTSAQYDAHGNTTQLGTAPVTQFGYDGSDRNISVTEGTKSLAYTRDAQNRITKRIFTDTANSGANNEVRYGFSSGSDTPDLLLNPTNQVVEKYLQLPGGALLTIRPNEPLPTNQKLFSLPNIHGDILTTTSAIGTKLADFTYDPFGNLTSASSPTNTATGSTFSWLGHHEKLTETQFALAPTQMGARVYLQSLGRFLQVDPVEGGVENNYVYPPNPVMMFDLDGKASFGEFFGWWGDRAKEFATGVYNAPVVGLGTYVDAAKTVVAPNSSFGDRAWAALMVTPVGKVGKIGKFVYESKILGVSSKLFGNARFGANGAGIWNNYGKLKIGWSHIGTQQMGQAIFRIGFKLFGGQKHINILRGPRLW